MKRSDWPFVPHVTREDKPGMKAVTIIMFVREPGGELSREAYSALTTYGRPDEDNTELTNHAIHLAVMMASPLPAGYTYTHPCIF